MEVYVKMNFENVKGRSIWILIILGILIAIVSALESHWQWLADLCGSFSSGCSEVRAFTFLNLPIAYWGIAFYIISALINRFAKKWLFWLVMAGMGAEITFVWMMYSLNMPCLFCLLNGLIMLLLFICLLQKRLILQTIAVCVVSFLISNFILTRENSQVVAAAGKEDSSSEQSQSAEDDAEKPYEFDIENSPTFGSRDAKVTIVEFSDYMCPSCRMLHPIASKIRQEYRDKVRWVFKDFPLSQHKGADRLAETARCAMDQNKFWEFQDSLFGAEQALDPNVLPSIAQTLGLDIPQFIECVESRKYMLEVIADRQDALSGNVNSTPSLFINGRKLKARTEEEFRKVIDEELKKQKSE